MLQEILVVAGSVLTLFLLMSVGFLFGKKGLLSDGTLSQMSRLLLTAVIPATMIDVFQVERSRSVDGQLIVSLLALAGVYLLYIALSVPLFPREGEQTRGVLRGSSIYGNVGFMGLPLIQSVMGNGAAMVAAMNLVVFNVMTFTHGAAVIGGKGAFSPKKAVLNPGVIGFVIAVGLYLLDLRLPAPVGSAVGYLGSLNTPLAMVVIGGQMASSDLAAAFRDRRLYLVSAIKLIGLPVLTALVLLPFRLDRVVYVTVVILSGCPTAGINSLFAQSMGRDAGLAARQLTLSTLLCILTLPLAALLARALAG